MSTVQISSYQGYDTKMAMHSATHKYDVSLAQSFQKHQSNAPRKNGVIYQVKYIKLSGKWKWAEIKYRV